MEELIYAVKSVENKEVNKTFTSWSECKPLVFGKKAVYKSFTTMEDAAEFLKAAPIKAEEFGHGYVPCKEGIHIMFGKFLFERCPEKEDGYSINVYETERKERFSCVGYSLPKNKRLNYAFTGQFIKDPKYGYEFMVDSYSEHISDSKDDVLNYLSSGIIKGIGPKKAELIYKKFGKQTIEVLEKNPAKLLSVKGISQKVLDKIISSYNDNKMSREVTSYLLRFGISPKYGISLYNQYGVTVLSRIQENPYLICMLSGLTYEDADRIAESIEYPMDSEERFRACAKYVLKRNEQTGNCGMEAVAFQQEMYERLGEKYVKKEQIFKNTCTMVGLGLIHTAKLQDAYGTTNQYLFSHGVYVVEKEIAQDVIRIRDSYRAKPDKKKIDFLLAEAEHAFRIRLDELQKEAIRTALVSNISIVTGGPGTGKTTIIRVLDFIYGKLYPDNKQIYLAPTGRASRKITESVGKEAFTAHSYLHIFDEVPEQEDAITISDAMTVVDEFSMADIFLAHALLESVVSNVMLVLVGDIDQLPSVGPGAVLRDIIESNAIEVIRLERIYRQGEDTEIYLNSRKINNGQINLKEGIDYHIHSIASMEDIKHEMGVKYCERVKEYGLGNVMLLCPFKEHIAGVFDMNNYLQALINPHKDGEMEVTYKNLTFRKNDIIMQQRRNTEFAANGDIGFITDICPHYDKDGELIEDDYDIYTTINQHTVIYSKDTIDELILAYAMTVHKSQGSEADAVIFCLSSFHTGMLFRNIPYVAISRGKKQVDTYGDWEAWEKAITNKDKSKLYRITLTKYFLQLANGDFVSYIA